MKKCLLTLSLITILSLVAQAQNFSATINSVVNSTVTGTPTLAPFSTDAEIETGLVTAPVTFAVKTNRAWKMMTSISGIVGTPLISGGPTSITAPLTTGNIEWGVINGDGGTVGTFNPFGGTGTSTTPVEAKTGNRGAPAVTGNTFTLQYKVTPGFNVDPGTYAVTVVNTISAQ